MSNEFYEYVSRPELNAKNWSMHMRSIQFWRRAVKTWELLCRMSSYEYEARNCADHIWHCRQEVAKDLRGTRFYSKLF